MSPPETARPVPAERVTQLYYPPTKRSVEIAGHKTSVSLEPLFWTILQREAAARDLPLNALVARIDAERIAAPRPPGLATAIRLWLVARLIAPAEPGASADDEPYDR